MEPTAKRTANDAGLNMAIHRDAVSAQREGVPEWEGKLRFKTTHRRRMTFLPPRWRLNSASVKGILFAGTEDPSGAFKSSAISSSRHLRLRQNLTKDFRRSSVLALALLEFTGSSVFGVAAFAFLAMSAEEP